MSNTLLFSVYKLNGGSIHLSQNSFRIFSIPLAYWGNYRSCDVVTQARMAGSVRTRPLISCLSGVSQSGFRGPGQRPSTNFRWGLEKNSHHHRTDLQRFQDETGELPQQPEHGLTSRGGDFTYGSTYTLLRDWPILGLFPDALSVMNPADGSIDARLLWNFNEKSGRVGRLGKKCRDIEVRNLISLCRPHHGQQVWWTLPLQM